MTIDLFNELDEREENQDKIRKVIFRYLPWALVMFFKLYEYQNREKRICFKVLRVFNASGNVYHGDSRKEIMINFHHRQTHFRKVFIHELGEADYVIRGFPTIENGGQIPDECVDWIYMLFTHSYVRSFAQNKWMSRYEKIIDDESIQSLKDKKYLSVYTQEEKWKIVLEISYNILTFPQLERLKNQMDGYYVYSKGVTEVLEIAKKTTIKSKPSDIKENMKSVIAILEDYGMPQGTYPLPK